MSAIITEKFRQHNARNFFESFSEASADVYFLFLGKATPFTTGTTGGSDSSPSTPADSVSREFYNWDSMLGAKKITSSDIIIFFFLLAILITFKFGNACLLILFLIFK